MGTSRMQCVGKCNRLEAPSWVQCAKPIVNCGEVLLLERDEYVTLRSIQDQSGQIFPRKIGIRQRSVLSR
jgi:hypothetical protein